MNKKGFTLVEILAVIVILALIITIVATNGFGAFNKSKDKITALNEAAIKEAANLLKLDIENCDDDVNAELVEDLLGVTNQSCSDLHSQLSSIGVNVDLPLLIDLGYIDGAGVEEINKNNLYEVKYTKDPDSGEIEVETINNFEEKYAKLDRDFLIHILDKINKTKLDIKEIHFVKNVENYTYNVDDFLLDENTSVYVWTKYLEDGIALYIGSEGKIYAPKNTTEFFYNFINVTTISFNNFDTSEVTNMYRMFANCNSLTTLDLSSFDTSIVEDMHYMFSGCWKLKTINFENFDTSEVKDMSYMFWGCNALEELNLNYFVTNNVNNMKGMFGFCSNLKILYIINFKTDSSVESKGMFGDCDSLQEVHAKKNNLSLDIRTQIFTHRKAHFVDVS